MLRHTDGIDLIQTCLSTKSGCSDKKHWTRQVWQSGGRWCGRRPKSLMKVPPPSTYASRLHGATVERPRALRRSLYGRTLMIMSSSDASKELVRRTLPVRISTSGYDSARECKRCLSARENRLPRRAYQSLNIILHKPSQDVVSIVGSGATNTCLLSTSSR